MIINKSTVAKKAANSTLSGYLIKKSFTTQPHPPRSSFKKIRRNVTYGLIFGTLGYFTYQYMPHKTRIDLSYSPTKENQSIVDQLSILKGRYYPTFYLSHHFLQSLYSGYGPDFRVSYDREYLPLSDGGRVALDWALPTKKLSFQKTLFEKLQFTYEPPADNKILFVIHGLTGNGSDSKHVKYLVRHAQENGYRVVVFNNRGYNQRLMSPVPSHGGKLEDIEEALVHIRKKYPNANIFGCGISFGGNQMLRLVAKQGEKIPFRAAAAVGSPIDLETVIDEMEGTIYERALLKKFVSETLLPSIDILESLKDTHGIDFEDVLRTRSLRDFHSKFTAKVFGHKDVKEFFEASKLTSDKIQNIKIPMLLMYAKDDPIVRISTVPVKELVSNPNIIYAETTHGCHICWLEGLKPASVTISPNFLVINC